MIVLKFGGTSVEDAAAIKRLAEIVGRQLEQRPLVVVSAMARATNRLLEIARLAANGETLEAMALVDSFTRRHETAAVALAPPAERNQLYDSIEVSSRACARTSSR
jgi:aspartate kinase